MLFLLVFGACSEAESDSEPTLPAAHPLDAVLGTNQLQALGSHNSYHVEPPANTLDDWRYTHVPLDQQLDEQGLRKFELDVYYDEERRVFDVFHIGILDAVSNCPTLRVCLQVMRTWSDAHRGHHPIFVMIEPKTNFKEELAEGMLEQLDEVVRDVMQGGAHVTPAEVQGDFETLREAVVTDGWPVLAQTRGRFVLWMDSWGEWGRRYSRNRTDLSHREIFVVSEVTDPVAAITNFNNPLTSGDQIRAAVEQGFIVRTRGDDALVGLAGDDTQLKAALESGAQLISSDFPAPVFGVDYHSSIPGGTPSRCNPINAPAECTSEAVEDPRRLTGR
jgi:hypothetical protein